MSKNPSDDVLESKYKLSIRQSDQLKFVLEIYDMEIHQKISMPNYQKIYTMVKRNTDRKLRLRNFDGKHERIESGAVKMSRKGPNGVERGKVICYQWKEKGPCSQRDRCSFRHETQVDAQKPEPKAATLSEPCPQKPEHTAVTPSEPTVSRGRSVSRKKSIRGKGNRASTLRQPCRSCMKGTCTRTSCEYWHPPECHFYKNETGCKAGDKCLFPHYMVDEQQNKRPKTSYFPKRRESDDKNAVAIVKSVSQLGCVSQDSDALVSQGRKSQGNPMQKVSG